jgi:hypothetical protein
MYLEDLVEGPGSQPEKETEICSEGLVESGFTDREENTAFRHPGHGVHFGNNGDTVKKAHAVAEHITRGHIFMKNYEIRCQTCGALGNISMYCRKRNTKKR